MTKSNAEILRENATSEFEVFKGAMLKSPNDIIFRSVFEINAKNEICGYLCVCAAEDLDEEELGILAELEGSVIETLYNYFLGAENASIMFYYEIAEWVHDFCQGVLKHEI